MHVRIRSVLFGAAVLLVAGLAVPESGRADTPAVGVAYGVESYADPGDQLTVDQLYAAGTVSSADTVSAATATPSGYKLIHPGYRRSDYVYDSDWIYHTLYVCNPVCTKRVQTRVLLHEVVIGGNSHYWTLRLRAQLMYTTAGYSWYFQFRYYCGVNVPNASDYECNNNASPSGTVVRYTDLDTFGKTWGSTNNITVFPMAGLSTHFSNGASVESKFRGYDTYSRASTTKLVPAGQSGTGG